MTTIYHNPRCSKSRDTLALLEAQGIQPTIIHYLDNPLDKATLLSLLKKLDLSPRDIIRKSEDAYKTLKLDNLSLTDEALIQALINHPKLLERPIVVAGNKAVIGRPPENVRKLIP
jgi:arsenate reductase